MIKDCPYLKSLLQPFSLSGSASLKPLFPDNICHPLLLTTLLNIVEQSIVFRWSTWLGSSLSKLPAMLCPTIAQSVRASLVLQHLSLPFKEKYTFETCSTPMPGFAAAVRRGRDRHQCDLACDCNRKASHVMTPYPCSRAKPLGHVPRPRPTCWPPTSSSLQSRRAWRTGRTLGAPSRRVRGRTASHSYSRCEVWN